MAWMIYYVSSNRLPEQMRINPVLHSCLNDLDSQNVAGD